MPIMQQVLDANNRPMPLSFRNATRRKSVRVGSMSFNGFGQTLRLDLPRTGLLAGLRVRFAGNVAVSGPSGSFPTYPWSPASTFKNITLQVSSGVNLWNTSGIGAYLHNAYRGLIGFTDVNPVGAHNSSLWTAVMAPLAGSVQTTNAVAGFYYIYPMIGQLDMRAMHLLQTDQVTTTLVMTTADAATLQGTSTGTATITAAPIVVNVEADIFELPAPPSQPTFELGWERVVQEFTGTTPIVGDTITPITVGGPIYNGLYGLLINNGAPALATDITKLQVRIAGGSTVIYDEDYYDHCLAIHRDFGTVPPTGSFAYNWKGGGTGVPNIYSERDVIDTRGLSDLSHTISIASGVSLTTPQSIYVMDFLLPRS